MKLFDNLLGRKRVGYIKGEGGRIEIYQYGNGKS